MDVSQQIAKFWELEELPSNKRQLLSVEETVCEEHLTKNTKRNKNGQFAVVQLPLRGPVETLGDSHEQTKKRLLSMEKRFEHNREYKKFYVDCVQEYERLGRSV